MDGLLLVLRLLLAIVFGVAGITKLADLPGSRSATREFGVPTQLATIAGVALPVIELTVAILLLPLATAWWAALAGLGLMLAFIAGIIYNLSKGRKPDCHCFGQVYSAPIGRSTLIRNSVFAAMAAVLVMQGPSRQGASLVAWLGDLAMADRVLHGLVAVMLGTLVAMGWILLHLMQQNGRLLLRIEALESTRVPGGRTGASDRARVDTPEAGLPIGSQAPSFSLSGLYGETVTLDALKAEGRPVVLVFTDPGCGPCNALVPEIERWQCEHAEALTVAVISRGKVKENVDKARAHKLGRVLLQREREVSQAYQSLPTPSAVLIRPDGTIDSRAALGSEAIRSLIARSTTKPAVARPGVANGNGVASDRPSSNVGSSAPALMLPDLDGRTVSLQEFQGKPTLVLFWNPGCGFCQRMLGDVKEWETSTPADAPQLLVISTGNAEENRAMGLRAPVLLDQGFAAGRAFGAPGTPSAVLIDEKGLIASDVTVGTPSVLKLASAGSVGA